ncbi:MAG: ATP-binding protein [Planctomycetota bacterium]
MLTLTVLEGPDLGKRFELPDHEPQLLGRSSEALPLTDNTVSRRHAELTPDAGGWYVRDLHSQNGTYLNNRPISQRVKLANGDQIRVGSTLLLFGERKSMDSSIVSLMSPRELDAEIETALPLVGDPDTMGAGDSMMLAEPSPSAAAEDHLRIIYRLVELTATATDRQSLLASVMELVFHEFEPERGFILLAGPAPDSPLKPAVVKYRTPPKDKDEARIKVSRTILQHALDKGEGVLSSNAMGDPRFRAGDSVQLFKIRSAICVPVQFRERTFGALYIDSSIVNYTFTEQQLALMNAIGRHTALALANVELIGEKLHTERLAAVGETVASLSHSVKNILQGLRGGADVVEMGLKRQDFKVASGGWEILKRNLDRIAQLTLNMLAYSSQKQVEYELQRVTSVIDDCVQLLEAQCQAKGVALIADADHEMPPIPIDPSLLHQALMNLVTNAVEAVEANTGAVTVRAVYHDPGGKRPGGPIGPAAHGGMRGAPTQATPPWVEIAVIDNGPGIPKDRQRWIFEPFHSTKGLRGTGLGLAVTKRVVEAHQGRLTLHSEPGKGSAFVIALPADTGGADPSKTADPSPLHPGGRDLLPGS